MYDINNVTDASDNDTEAQAAFRKDIRDTLEGMSDSGAILAHALGAASGCWENLDKAGVFRLDLMHVIFEETSKRLWFTSNPNKTDVEKFSIYGDGLDAWLVYDVGYHTCGGYGPESGYVHEPGCGQEPVIQMKDIQGIHEWISHYE